MSEQDLDRLEAVVADGGLVGVVDQVARRVDGGYRLTGEGGQASWAPGEEPTVVGTNPVADQDPAALLDPDDHEPRPSAAGNAFPHAYDNVAQLFDAAHAPDAVVLPHPGQRLDGVVGHHGGLGVVQARAPFVAAGPGVVARGWVDEHLRMVDVAPTLVALAGGAPLAVQDGAVPPGLVAGTTEHLLVFLLDGTNASALWAAVAAGDAPTIAGLVEEGTAYRHGVLACLPTATLANHTTALTGAAPGRSGVLHHTWHDRGAAATPNLLEMPAMFGARAHLAPGVETVYEAIKRGRADAVAVCCYEFMDRGADWSTFAFFDRGERLPWPTEDEVAATSDPTLLANDNTAFMCQVDTASAKQAVERFSGRDHDLPAFCWVSFSVTDNAGHAEGPHGPLARAAIRDSDRRMATVLRAVEDAGIRDRTTVVVLADHGMQRSADAEPVGLDEHLPPDRWHLVDHLLAYAKPSSG